MLVKSKHAGFTLIELMIVIALFVILASFAAPSYKRMIQNNKIRNAAESIQGGIQLARAEAVKRNASVQFDLRGSDSAWTVCIAPSPAADCPAGDNIQSRSIGDGSSTDIDVTGDTGPFVFNSLGIMNSPTSTAEIDIDNAALTTAESRELRVAITVGGSSKMCDPALLSAGTDPRRCP